MTEPTRWVTDTKAGHSEWYVERFRRMAAEGADLGGEARLIDAMLPPGAGSSTRAAGPAGSAGCCTSAATRSSGSTRTRC